MKIGLLLDACGRLPDALDPGFHRVPVGLAHLDDDADGADVT